MATMQEILGSPEKLQAIVDAVFEEFDKDKHGTIDEAELKGAIESFNENCPPEERTEITDEQIQEALKELDKNNDGKLQKDEFKVLIVEVLKSL